MGKFFSCQGARELSQLRVILSCDTGGRSEECSGDNLASGEERESYSIRLWRFGSKAFLTPSPMNTPMSMTTKSAKEG